MISNHRRKIKTTFEIYSITRNLHCLSRTQKKRRKKRDQVQDKESKQRLSSRLGKRSPAESKTREEIAGQFQEEGRH